MKRTLVTLLFGGLLATACNKPSEEQCLQAIENVRRIMGTDSTSKDLKRETDDALRRCKGGSTKKSVECAIAAKTRDDLLKCEGWKKSEPKADSEDKKE